MRWTFMTYRILPYLLLLVIFYNCSAAEMEDQETEPTEVTEDEEMTATEEYYEAAAELSEEESTKKDESVSIKKWKNKAQQQLESIEDLLLILNDTTLDKAFRFEIEKELNLLYDNKDSMLNSLVEDGLEFKGYKSLEVESGDTLSLLFKNHKNQLKARFIVVSESKDFGGISEIVERLKIISIQPEN